MEKAKVSTDSIPLLRDMEIPKYSPNEKEELEKRKEGKRVKKLLMLMKILLVAITVFLIVVAFVIYCLCSCLLELPDNLEELVSELPLEVERFTSVKESKSFPLQQVALDDVEALKETAISFWDSIQSGPVPEDFILTAADVNGFFASFDFLGDSIFTEMKPNECQLSLSLPTDFLPGGTGRFFNGYATVKWFPEINRFALKVDSTDLEDLTRYVDVEFELTSREGDKTLNLQVLKGKAFGYEIPEEFIDEQYNLLEDFYDCGNQDVDCNEARNFLTSIAGISLEDGQVVVHTDK